MKKSYCEVKKGRIKFGGYKGGRGYCGWYTTKNNKNIFLRSLKEFFIAKKLDYENKIFLMEKITFNIDGENYKPDFFIYEDSNFKKIVEIIEVKDSLKNAEPYFRYEKYFDNIGIRYKVIYNIDCRKIYPFITKADIKNWKKQYIKEYNYFDYSGEKNPMFGVKHSELTKKKIGNATKQYFKIESVRQKHRESRHRFWDSSEGKKQKLHYAELRHNERDIKNPIEDRTCVWCKKIFKIRKKFKKMACSNSCIQKYNWSIGKSVYTGDGKKSYKTKISMYSKHIKEKINKNNFDALVLKYKEAGKIPINFGISVKTIEKYFGNFESYIGELYWEN